MQVCRPRDSGIVEVAAAIAEGEQEEAGQFLLAAA